MHCPNCGTKNTARAKFCVNCGEELPQLKKGMAVAAAPPPAVQQIVIKQKTNWLNAVFGILLLAILFCVGSVFLMDATETSAATVQEMIAEPQLYFDGLGRLTDQFVTGAKVLIANIAGGDDGGDAQDGADGQQGILVNNDLCAATFYQPPSIQALNWEPGDTLNFNISLPILFGGVDNPQTNAVDNFPKNTPLDEWMIANNLAREDLANTVQVDISGTRFQYCNMDFEGLGQPFVYEGDPNIPNSENYDPGFYLNCAVTTDHAVPQDELTSIKLYAFGCSQPLAIDQMTIPAGGVANAADGGGGTAGGGAGDICSDPLYDAPRFKAVNWFGDTLNVDLFVPIFGGSADGIKTPFDEWVKNEAQGRNEYDVYEETFVWEVNGQNAGTCKWISQKGGRVNRDGDGPGIEMSCQYSTTRQIEQLELANVALYGFGCEQPIGENTMSIPPKELEAYEPPVEEEVACPEGYRKNLKGKCVSNDPSQEVGGSCNAGDVMDHIGNCCSPSTYVSSYDSCDPPYYTP